MPPAAFNHLTLLRVLITLEAILSIAYAALDSIATVDVRYARYRGVAYGSNHTAYRGMRYARADRYAAPRTPGRSADLLLANDTTTVCPQPKTTGTPLNATMTEDCLLLDVYTPINRTEKALLPTFVWIHGGGYWIGSRLAMGPEAFEKWGSGPFVFVSINYRLGHLGFLSGRDYQGLPNAGLQDQQYALRWVQQHITKFGGDPRNVTVAGASAGGGSILQQVVAKDHEGLFHRIWGASPFLSPQPPLSSPRTNALYDELASKAGCSGARSFECLQHASFDRLLAAGVNTTLSHAEQVAPWPVVVDGSFITEHPIKTLRRRGLASMSVVSGSNLHEGLGFLPSPSITTEGDVRAAVRTLLPGFAPSDVKQALELYPAPGGKISSALAYYNQAGRAAEMFSDAFFRCLADELVSSAGVGYRYEYGVNPGLHTLDTGYYWPLQRPLYTAQGIVFSDFVQQQFITPLAAFIREGVFRLSSGDEAIKYKHGRRLTSIQAIVADSHRFVYNNVNLTNPVNITGARTVVKSGRRLSPSGEDKCEFWMSRVESYYPQ